MTAYMVDTIYIIKYMGVDVYNDPVDPPDDIEVKGKIEYKTRFLSDLSGQEVVAGSAGRAMSSASVLLPGSIDVDLERELQHEDRLKFNDIEHKILAIERPKAFSSYFVFKYKVWVA